jgi:cysteinyl-tRNA synthetase
VIYARNITDVDDKINARAAQEGISIRELTEKTAAQFHADLDALNCLPPSIEPRATEHIKEMIALVEQLIARGHAYAAEGHVLFDVASDPNYGSLARRSTDEMRAGARVEVAPYKRDPMDFVLWKPSEDSEPGWESPWGFGRPGWHLECSAMSAKHLGEVFDIHCGGIDLVFPHHENELAQSTCAHGTPVMANVWMHNGHLQVEGQKMSKSAGNFLTIHGLVEEMPAEAVRFQLLMSHYRQPFDWTAAGSAQAKVALVKFSRALKDVPAGSLGVDTGIYPPFLEALKDDLNTPEAIASLHALEEEIRAAGLRREGLQGQLFNSLALMGLEGVAEFEERLLASDKARLSIDEAMVKERIEARIAARKAKNWAEADRIRDELAGLGIALMDKTDPITREIETTWEIAR